MTPVHVDKTVPDAQGKVVLIRVSLEGFWAEFRRVAGGKRDMRCNTTGPSYRGQQVKIPARIWRRLTSKAAARMFEGESAAKPKPAASVPDNQPAVAEPASDKPKPGELL
ncbi:MAG: hypothetical protein AAB389_03635 [Patescibacteria group bacterium]